MIHNVLTTLSHKNIFYEQINNTNIGGMCFKKKKKKITLCHLKILQAPGLRRNSPEWSRRSEAFERHFIE